MAMPTWIYEAQAIGSIIGAVAAAVIAYAGIRIARRQSITAAQKLRLDMFPLRFSVYRAAFYAILEVTAEPNIRSPTEPSHAIEKFREFQEKLLESRFLFNKDNFEYFDRLNKELLKFKRMTGRLQSRQGSPDNPKSIELDNQQSELEDWLTKQLGEMAAVLEGQLKVEDGATFSKQAPEKTYLGDS